MTAPESPAPPHSDAHPVPEHHRHHRELAAILLAIILLPIVVFSLWAWGTLGYAYSRGERAGYVQKLSKKGWLCKTWEGEIAMANLPGTMPELFSFSVRSDSIAGLIEKTMGKRVSLTYEQHKGVPTSCFGETQYFITNVRLVSP
jgi:hypothetical protein